jgi:hypothetical protein
LETGKHALVGGLVFGLMLIMVLSSASPVRAQSSSSSNQLATTAVNLQVQPLYDVLGSNTIQINVTVSGVYSSPIGIPSFTVTTNFRPSVSNGTADVNGVPTPLIGTTITQVGESITTFPLPTGATSFRVYLPGSESGSTFLWRYLITPPFVSVTGFYAPTQYFITVPPGSIVSQVYAGPKGVTLSPGDLTQVGSGPAGVTYNVPNNFYLLALQSRSFLPASIAITAAALVIVALAALNLFTPVSQSFQRLSAQLRATANNLAKTVGLPTPGRGFKFRSLFQPRKLLVLFILCALVMVALAAVGGPDPRLKAYVMASPGTTTAITTELHQYSANVLVITPSQDFSDFNVMSSVGQFNLVVISNDPPSQLGEQIGFVLPYLGNVPVIMVDNSTSQSLNETINTLYPNQVINVNNNAGNLTIGEQSQLRLQLSLNARTNVLGLSIDVDEFKALLGVEAVLSMVLIFIGWAYIGSLASESRSMSDLFNLVLLFGGGVFIFFFSETLYIATSSLLAVPLSLHAVNSDAHDITAIGLLGFGGGSTPRLAAGFLGILVGAVGAGGGLRVRKSDFALIAGVALILLANPLSIGQYVFQGILLLYPIGSLAFGGAFATSLSIKGFLYGFGTALGGSVTPTYLLSAGKMIFFAGLAPLAYLKRMGRTTTVIALLVAALMVGDGGVRVGEMTPDKTVAAVLPGLVAGFAFAAVLLGFAAIEKYVRGNWKSRA